MKNLNELNQFLPEYAKDIKINLQNLISQENQVLSAKQIFGSALASAYSTKEKTLIEIFENEAKIFLSDLEINAVKISTILMAMNNIYYRFAHISHDKEYLQMPANLRMRGIVDHGIEKIDFEIFALATSIINGCSGCIDAHANQIIKSGMSKNQVQMVAKIAAVVNSLAQILTIEKKL